MSFAQPLASSLCNAVCSIRTNFSYYIADPIIQKTSFIYQAITKSETVGAWVPSSSYSANLIIKPLKEDSSGKPRYILELGAGEGVFTKKILSEMRKDDTLTIVECIPEFAKKLSEIVEGSNCLGRVVVCTTRIENFKAEHKFTHVINAMPLTFFPSEDVLKFYTRLENDLLDKGATYSTIEYPFFPKLRLLVGKVRAFCGNSKPHKELSTILDLKEKFLTRHGYEKDFEIRNFPPAHIIHVQKQAPGKEHTIDIPSK